MDKSCIYGATISLRAATTCPNSLLLLPCLSSQMKVYVHYEEGSDAELHVTLKLTLPKKWNDESPVKLLKVVVYKYCTRIATVRHSRSERRGAAVWDRAVG